MGETKEVTQEEIKEAHVGAIQDELQEKNPKKAHKKPESKFRVGQRLHITTLRDREHFKIPADEQDPHWDAKLKNPVPDGLVDNLADFDWDETHAALALPDGTLVHGRTRWRALEKADRLREKAKLGHVQPWVVITDEKTQEEIVHNMERGISLNYSVQDIDPMTKAESIYRLASAGVDDKTNAKRHNVSVNDLHGYYLILDESKCPPEIQELLRTGMMPLSAALELARKAESMTKGELVQAAEQIAKVAAGGLKVTAAQVKRAAGVEGTGPATQKERKQLILDLQSGELRGKQAEGAKWGAILMAEVGLGTRTVNSFWSAISKVAQGQEIRVDFKQYISDANVGKGMETSKPVKGQEAPKKKSKKKSKKK